MLNALINFKNGKLNTRVIFLKINMAAVIRPLSLLFIRIELNKIANYKNKKILLIKYTKKKEKHGHLPQERVPSDVHYKLSLLRRIIRSLYYSNLTLFYGFQIKKEM